MRKFFPLHDRVLVLPDAIAVKVGGLAQAPSQKEEPTEGIIVAVGPEVTIAETTETVSGTMDPLTRDDLVGCRVQWTKYAGRPVMHNDKKHILLRIEEIDGVIADV